MKFSKNFERDYNWYLRVREFFLFDGTKEYYNKKGENIIIEDTNEGLTAKECFYLYDSRGVIKPTREVEELKSLLKTKGSVNLHIKMYAEDLYRGYIFKVDLEEIYSEIDPPEWFKKAIEEQSSRLFKKSDVNPPFLTGHHHEVIKEKLNNAG